MADESDSKSAAVYVAWTTFNNTLNALAKVMPKKIDKSTFTGQSGGVQNQLMAGYKFLGLIAEDGTPLPALQSVAVLDETLRKERVKKVLEQRYADIFALGLESTTPDQLNNTMANSYKVSGDTRDKAVRFFMAAVEYVGIPISPYLKKAAASGSSSSRKRRSTRKREDDDEDGGGDDSSAEAPTRTSPGSMRVITLASGGTVTVIVAVDLLALSADDQAFVFGLKSKLDEYEKANSDDVF